MSRAPYPTLFPTPGKPPHPAAAVILLRPGAPDRVYTVRRSPKLRFLGGFGGYPGGRVDREDAALAGVEDRQSEAAGRVGAARELFEEAGVLICPGADRVDDGDLDRAREDLLDGRASFAAVCERLGVDPVPAPDVLHMAGRWITPYYSPLRFDTYYFVHVYRGVREPSVWPGELVEGGWRSPAEVLASWEETGSWLAPPVTETLCVLAGGIDPLEEALPRLRTVADTLGHPFHPVRMRHGVRMLPLASRALPPAIYTNVFVVGERELVVVDPGASPGEPRELLWAALDGLLAEGRRLRAAILTHHHLDHVDSAVALRDRYEVPIVAHGETARALREARQHPYRPELAGFEVDGELTDCERLELDGGFVLEVLHTPGHARGHICLHEHRSGSLFVGDLVSGLSPVIIDPPEGDMGQYLVSLQRVFELGDLGLFPGHGPPAVSSQFRVGLLRKHRLRRRQRVLQALADAPDGLGADGLIPAVYEDVPATLHPFAARSLHAHLLQLADEGAVERLDGDLYRLQS